jgi:POT family proton-dependent oligopeptide transporter
MTVTQEPATPNGAPTMFGHPPGLFGLFFVEMWERFSFYGMRALLTFYMIKGFLGYGDSQAYGVYAAYGALVYATPFIGGMLADRLLGARRSVILGAVLMSLGHLSLAVESSVFFYMGLAFLVAGNGLFKPNISTIVGGLYPGKDIAKRDGGFTIFYMGINLGAAMSPLLCGYIGETYGWHYGFGIATIGMLIGLATFVVPNGVARFLILASALGTAALLFIVAQGGFYLMVNITVGLALVAAGVIAFVAMGRGSLPRHLGAVPSPALLRKYNPYVYGGVLLAVLGFTFLLQADLVAKIILYVLGAVAFGSLIYEAFRMKPIARHRLLVALILMFFSMLFWALFEQAGSSISNFTDRNVDRVFESRTIQAADIGQSVTLDLTQEQLGFPINGTKILLGDLDKAREAAQKAKAGPATATIQVDAAHLGMGVGTAAEELPASVFQSANPIFILIFGLLFSAGWVFLAKRRLEPSIPVKFALGLVQLGLGFVALWFGAQNSDDRGMVGVGWLVLGYLLHTTGELCLSPVGLSMVTKLSPKRMISTVMGAWFLATAYSYLVGGFIAKLTDVSEGGEGAIPAPIQTVHIYGDVFLKVAISIGVAAVVLFALSPLLTRWTHPSEPEDIDSERIR